MLAGVAALGAVGSMQNQRLEDFGPYAILRSIAIGGMAEIYLARQRALEGVERLVVIKRILDVYAEDVEFITMFLDETRLMAALSHPNIAQVFEVGKVEGTHYLTMEYVRGPTLGHLLAATRAEGTILPRREALGIALAIAEALNYVHERRDEVGRPLNIVHRDLNPANVMVSYDGAVKLIDFGIAKAATKVYETRAGVIKGTYGYMAPEQLAGTRLVDRRADVFTMGILLYEMVVGEHPYDASKEPNLIDRILEARYRRPRDVRSDVPRDLDRLIASCLAPHPEGRPDDMGEVIEALARHLGEEGLVPTLTGLAGLARRLVPDDEGPRPLRPLTAREYRRPFGDEPSGTKRLPLSPVTRARESRPAPEPKPRQSSAPPVPEWTSSAIGDDEPLTIADSIGAREGQLATDSLIRMADTDSDIATLHRKLSDVHPPHGEEDEHEHALTKLMPLAEAEREKTPTVPPRRGSSIALYLGLGLGAVAALGLLAFGIARFVRVDDQVMPDPPVAGPPAEAGVATEADIELRLLSEPPGGAVYVDGVAQEGVTPLHVTLPPGTRQIWVRITLDGHFDQERQILAAVGEARFVLSEIERDAGLPDAGPLVEPDAAAPVPDAGQPRRRRRRRTRRPTRPTRRRSRR